MTVEPWVPGQLIRLKAGSAVCIDLTRCFGQRTIGESPIRNPPNWPITETHGARWPPALCSLVSHLDYSCGKETLANAIPQFTVHGYESAIPGLDIHPEPHDLFICADVLEHVEPEFVGLVIDDNASVWLLCSERLLLLYTAI